MFDDIEESVLTQLIDEEKIPIRDLVTGPDSRQCVECFSPPWQPCLDDDGNEVPFHADR